MYSGCLEDKRQTLYLRHLQGEQQLEAVQQFLGNTQKDFNSVVNS